MMMNTLYMDYPLKYKGLAFVPSLFAFVCFILFIYYFGRWKPAPTDPYAGRLKKRRKYPRLSRIRESIMASFRRRSAPGKHSPVIVKPAKTPPPPLHIDDSRGNSYSKLDEVGTENAPSKSKVSFPQNWDP